LTAKDPIRGGVVSPRRSIWQPNGDAPKSSSSCSAAAPTPNPDSAGCDNWTPLQIAIHRDRALVVELLLAGGANVTIWAAAALGRLDIVETFGEQVIALGPNDATQGRKLNLPGNELEGVYDGMEFLRSFNEGTPDAVGGADCRHRRWKRGLRRPPERAAANLDEKQE